MSIEIKIPVHPAVPKFLSLHYKTKPFSVSLINPYGNFLYNAITKNVKRVKREGFVHCSPVLRQNSWGGFYVERPDPRRKLKNAVSPAELNTKIYSATLTISLSPRIYENKGSELADDRIVHFNKMVLDVIDKLFYLYMDMQTANGKEIYSSILTFREKYGFQEEDLAVKTLEKKYERYRKR